MPRIRAGRLRVGLPPLDLDLMILRVAQGLVEEGSQIDDLDEFSLLTEEARCQI